MTNQKILTTGNNILMYSQDFSSRSLDMSEESKTLQASDEPKNDLRIYEMRRTWEKRYLIISTYVDMYIHVCNTCTCVYEKKYHLAVRKVLIILCGFNVYVTIHII